MFGFRELSHTSIIAKQLNNFMIELNYSTSVWVETERMRLPIRVAKISFLYRVAGLSLRGR